MKLTSEKRRIPDIPIISLIDILAILLIFFIISTTFKKPRPVLEIDLPTVKQVSAEKVTDTRAILAIAADGRINLNDTEVKEAELADYLIAFKKINPEKKLELEADKEVNLKQMFSLWDALTRAGFNIKDVPARIEVDSE